MALTPTEREEHFFKAMVDAADGSTPEELEPTERREHWYKEIIDAIKAGGGGSGGGGLVVNETVSETRATLDKTFKQIEDGMTSGGVVIVSAVENSSVSVSVVIRTYKESGVYEVYGYGDVVYGADSEDGYPYFDFGG